MRIIGKITIAVAAAAVMLMTSPVANAADVEVGVPVVERVRVSANVIVGQYTLDELVDLIGGGDDGEPSESDS